MSRNTHRQIPLRTGELEALRWLLAFTETAAGVYGPEALAHHLASDLIQRAHARTGPADIDRYLAAHRYAIEQASHLQARRRRQTGDT